MSISSIIDELRKRPGVYLGKNQITPLRHYLYGYRAAELDYGQSEGAAVLPLDFSFMHSFVNLVFAETTNMGWCNQILENCGGDEEKALWKFFELYDKFRQIKMTKYHKAVLSPENIRYNDSMEHGCRHTSFQDKEPIFRDPLAVYVIELDVHAYILAVETIDNIKLMRHFYDSAENAMGNGRIHSGAEDYFGKISGWTEYTAENLEFDKKIQL